MRTFQSVFAMMLLLSGLASGSIGFGQVPFGSITNQVVGKTNALWDVSLFTGLQSPVVWEELSPQLSTNYWRFLQGQAGASEPVPTNSNRLSVRADTAFIQDGRGRLVGNGTNTVSLTFWSVTSGDIFYPWTNLLEVPSFGGSYLTRGSIVGNHGNWKLHFGMQVAGETLLNGNTCWVSASQTVLSSKKATNSTIQYRVGDRISISGQRSLFSGGSGTDSMPYLMGDGAWTLVLTFNPVAPGAPTRLSGSATVTLSAGTIYPFQFTGRYSPKTGRSTLLLKGVSAGNGTTDGRGATLSVTLANGQVTRLLGWIGGQAINQN